MAPLVPSRDEQVVSIHSGQFRSSVRCASAKSVNTTAARSVSRHPAQSSKGALTLNRRTSGQGSPKRRLRVHLHCREPIAEPENVTQTCSRCASRCHDFRLWPVGGVSSVACLSCTRSPQSSSSGNKPAAVHLRNCCCCFCYCYRCVGTISLYLRDVFSPPTTTRYPNCKSNCRLRQTRPLKTFSNANPQNPRKPARIRADGAWMGE